MGKILKVFVTITLLCAFGFGATTHRQEIARFDREYKKATTDQILKFHHALKNIYIQSIIKNNKNLKISALQRLVITSSKLGLDTKPYEKELQTLGKTTKKKIYTPKTQPIPSVAEPKAPKIPVFDAKKLFISKNRDTIEKKIKEEVKEGKARITKTSSSHDTIIITFDRKIHDIAIRSFALKGKKTYRYVYDIGAILNGGARVIDFKKAKRVRIGQYNKKTVRIVFTNPAPLKLYYSKTDNTIQIGFKKGVQGTPIATTTKSSTKSLKTTSFNSSSKIIVIDAGHGGKDGGAIGSRTLLEKKEVLKVALKLGRELKKRGYKVYYTRTKDKFIQLRTRTKMANNKNADIFISIHANAAPNKKRAKQMQGIETFFLSPARSKRSKNVAALENKSDIAEMDFFSKQTFLNFLNREKIISSNKLALDVQQGMLNALKKSYKIVDGGVREAPFWVLVGAQMPSILVEIGYITHPAEGKRIASSNYQAKISKGIANGIDAYFAKNF